MRPGLPFDSQLSPSLSPLLSRRNLDSSEPEPHARSRSTSFLAILHKEEEEEEEENKKEEVEILFENVYESPRTIG